MRILSPIITNRQASEDSQLTQPSTLAWKESGGDPRAGSAPYGTTSPLNTRSKHCVVQANLSLSLPSPLPPEENPPSLAITNYLRCDLRLLVPVYVTFQDALTSQTISSPIGILLPKRFDGQ